MEKIPCSIHHHAIAHRRGSSRPVQASNLVPYKYMRRRCSLDHAEAHRCGASHLDSCPQCRKILHRRILQENVMPREHSCMHSQHEAWSVYENMLHYGNAQVPSFNLSGACIPQQKRPPRPQSNRHTAKPPSAATPGAPRDVAAAPEPESTPGAPSPHNGCLLYTSPSPRD